MRWMRTIVRILRMTRYAIAATSRTPARIAEQMPTSFQLSGGRSRFGSISMPPVTTSRAAGGAKMTGAV